MAVEILNYNSGDVLDLVPPKKEEPTDEVLPTEGEELPEGVEGEVPEQTGEPADSTDAVPEPDEPDTLEGEYFFGDASVTVTVPDEVKGALADAGVDEKTLIGELFAKDGKFELSEDTRSKLEDKFGKTIVDGYLSMYRKMNEMSMKEHAASVASKEEQEAEFSREYSDMVGGEEGLTKIEAYITENFDDKQIASYNAIMETDNHAAHMLVLSQVKQSMELASKLKNGDTDIKLLGDGSASGKTNADPIDKGWISRAEYDSIMAEDKYWTDKKYSARVDAARMAGMRQGK